MGKLIIFSAPSGAGKSTLINYLLTKKDLKLEFSISATSRPPRGEEKHGREYYFLSVAEFRRRIANNEFVEFEEVYTDKFYGTLKSEVERIIQKGSNVIFDVDVVGGCKLKKIFGKDALSMFIAPPSIEVLQQRLESRATDSAEVIQERIHKAELELTYAPSFDVCILNEDLQQARKEAYDAIKAFIL